MSSNRHLEAYRTWTISLKNQEIVLASYHNRECWPTYEPFVASCKARAHEVPNLTCECGIYGLKYQFFHEANVMAPVSGRVALWGRYAEGPWGYRAEYAYPLEFFCFKCVRCHSSKKPEDLTACSDVGDLSLVYPVTLLCNRCIYLTEDKGRRTMDGETVARMLVRNYGLQEE